LVGVIGEVLNYKTLVLSFHSELLDMLQNVENTVLT